MYPEFSVIVLQIQNCFNLTTMKISKVDNIRLNMSHAVNEIGVLTCIQDGGACSGKGKVMFSVRGTDQCRWWWDATVCPARRLTLTDISSRGRLLRRQRRAPIVARTHNFRWPPPAARNPGRLLTWLPGYLVLTTRPQRHKLSLTLVGSAQNMM